MRRIGVEQQHGPAGASSAPSPVVGGETLDGNRLLTTKQAAEYTTYSPHGLENLRCAGKGPAFIKVAGGAVAYRPADLIAWQQQHASPPATRNDQQSSVVLDVGSSPR